MNPTICGSHHHLFCLVVIFRFLFSVLNVIIIIFLFFVILNVLLSLSWILVGPSQTKQHPLESQTKQPRAPAPTKRRRAAWRCEVWHGAARWATHLAGFLHFFFYYLFFFFQISQIWLLATFWCCWFWFWVCELVMGRCFRFWVCEVV